MYEVEMKNQLRGHGCGESNLRTENDVVHEAFKMKGRRIKPVITHWNTGAEWVLARSLMRTQLRTKTGDYFSLILSVSSAGVTIINSGNG